MVVEVDEKSTPIGDGAFENDTQLIQDQGSLPPKLTREIIAIVNTRSGGQVGKGLMTPLIKLLGEDHVCDIFASPIGPEKILQNFLAVDEDGNNADNKKSCRILVCGGDGTVNWVLAAIEKMMRSAQRNDDAESNSVPNCAWPGVAVLPLGTGNDLSRQFQWGHGAVVWNGRIKKLLEFVDTAEDVPLDRWKVVSRHYDAPETDRSQWLKDEDEHVVRKGDSSVHSTNNEVSVPKNNDGGGGPLPFKRLHSFGPQGPFVPFCVCVTSGVKIIDGELSGTSNEAHF